MKKSFGIVLFFLLSHVIVGQQETRNTQYMFNLYEVNTAYAGSRESMSFAAAVRSQWTGIDGAPNLQSVTMNTPILTKNMGIGVKFRNESAGASSQTRVSASFAYRFRLFSGKLAFGLSAGMLNNRFNWAKASFKNPLDQRNTGGTESSYNPTFDFAAYYSTHSFYLGAQIDNINEARVQVLENSEAKNYYHLTAIMGKAFILNRRLVFKPSVLYRSTQGAQQFEVNASLLFNSRLWTGLSYRTGNEFSLILEYNLNQKFRFGYSYDFSLEAIQTANSGSHEFFLGYDIQVKNKNMVSSRYF